ncbi:hypothetical protein CVT26_007884 [Gymnopilus dilepis]|uniref:DUF6534 domain-containing protein n=1 Tax=Gymnopilus dilepis TaxID=231916 RepID=A0A409YKD3_9AGAR|nr:hypothetical protein CVT26_007884 [Gymnopilus dilepis]
MASVDIARSFGALLVGGLFASLLSGFVMVQTYLYYKMYPSDLKQLKTLVFSIWFLDTCHTAFIWSALWSYLIDNYGDANDIDIIHWNVAARLTIVMTAILTFLVHFFFAHRIFMLSKKNYYITTPIVLLACLRLVSACVTTAEMFHFGTFSGFRDAIKVRDAPSSQTYHPADIGKWIFTTGLALSTAVDILITGSLFILLHTSRTGAAKILPSLNAVIDALIMYAFETGFLTCAGTVISMICWLVMPSNLIFMGLHFVIGKLYATSLLVTLNMRENIRRGRSGSSKEFGAPVILDARRRRTGESDQLALSGIRTDSKRESSNLNLKGTMLEVNVERTIHYDL